MPHTFCIRNLQYLQTVYKQHFLIYSIYVGISFYIWQLTALYQLHQRSSGTLWQHQVK